MIPPSIPRRPECPAGLVGGGSLPSYHAQGEGLEGAEGSTDRTPQLQPVSDVSACFCMCGDTGASHAAHRDPRSRLLKPGGVSLMAGLRGLISLGLSLEGNPGTPVASTGQTSAPSAHTGTRPRSGK